MKVWLVDPISYSGMAYYDYGLIKALSALDVRATLIGSDRWLLRGQFEVERYRPVFRGTSGAAPRWVRGARYLTAAFSLIRSAMQERPEVVHWQYLQIAAVDLLVLRILRGLGVAVIFTSHEVVPWRASRMTEWLVRRVYQTVDRVIVHNDDDVLVLSADYGVSTDRISVIPHGDYGDVATPDASQAEARARLRLPANAPIALLFGSLRPSKGLEALLGVWASVREHVPEAMLIVAGRPQRDGPNLDLKRAPSGVRFRLEVIPVAEANDYYRAADLVVLPYEEITTSGVMRYAYSSARPVLATAVGEHPRWVVPGETGELIPPRRPERLSAALVRLLSDTSHLREMGEHALAISRQHFAWGPIAQSTLRCYEQAVRGRGGRGTG